MSKREELKIEIPSLDNLFTTQEERDEEKLRKIQEIPLELIDDFPDHPFKVIDDEDMFQLVDSIKDNGILTPAILRKTENGRYEIISGHRRRHASELAGLKTLRAEVVDISRDEAIIQMVDSNLQRTTILPSEKAFAYKMRLEAMKRSAGRPIKNLSPEGTNYPRQRSDAELAAQVGESRNQIQRFIRLTFLVPELLQMVDENKLGMRQAVEISYMPEEKQRDLVDCIDAEVCIPSHDQTIRMRKLNDDEKLDYEAMLKIMQEEKPNQKERIVLNSEKVFPLLPKNLQRNQREAYILEALKTYQKIQNKNKSKEDLER